MSLFRWAHPRAISGRILGMYPTLILAALMLSMGVFTGCGTKRPPLRTVDHVDLSRMAGTWYVIYNIPYWLEKDKVATADVYKIRPDGRMDNTFVFRRGSFSAPEKKWHGIAWVVDKTTNAHWKVRFIWPFSTDYMIIDKDPNYAWVAVGHPSRNYFWILASTRQLDPGIVEGIMVRAEAQGYDRTRFAAVPQPVEPSPPEK